MQCLFCGKELALLKRLRGGGEFCSEAHRKEYQDQYEQLALARLMQAKPPTQPPPPDRVPLARPSAEPARAPHPGRERPAEVVPVSASIAAVQAAVYAEAPPSAKQAAEETGPGQLAGFVTEPLVASVTPFEQASPIEPDNNWRGATALPDFSQLNWANQPDFTDSNAAASSTPSEFPPPAPRVELTVSLQALEHHTRTSERGLELREFTGQAPVMELQLRPETGSEPAGADAAMEILMSPRPPQKAKSWLGLPHGFPAAPAELGDLARLDFATTGFAYSDGPLIAVPAAVPAQSLQHAEVSPGVLTKTESQPAVEPLAPDPASPEPAPAEFVTPELVTKVLPVTLHGLAATHGKLTQAFPAPLAAASDVQIPPSATLPLRPLIILGPRPVIAQPAQVKPVQPGPAPSTPASRPLPIKLQATPGIATPEKEIPAAEKTEERIQKTSAPKASASIAPAVNPRAASSAASQASVPSLRLEATESAWSKLSTGVKIGVAAALVVGLSGIAYLVTRGSGKATNEAPVAVTSPSAVASGVPISGGWIDDWANSVQPRRHISMLSGSAKLSDYRLEFQAQIQTKAIGWIFRGQNPRNYYVTKLEIVTPGLEPSIALVHFAVVDGHDENRVAVPLPMKVRIDTIYKIRFDAFGNRFTTWVQDQKIDEWTDSRFGSGGVGFFSERDELAAMQGPVNVVPLVPKN
jgi:hypothetical protein